MRAIPHVVVIPTDGSYLSERNQSTLVWHKEQECCQVVTFASHSRIRQIESLPIRHFLGAGHKPDQIRSDRCQRRKGAEREARSAWRSQRGTALHLMQDVDSSHVVCAGLREDISTSTRHQSCILQHLGRPPGAQPWRKSCATVQRQVKCRMMVRPCLHESERLSDIGGKPLPDNKISIYSTSRAERQSRRRS